MGDAVIMGRAVVVIRMTSRGGTARVRRVLRKVKGGVEGRSQCLSVWHIRGSLVVRFGPRSKGGSALL